MTDTTQALEARKEIIERWGDIFEGLVAQMQQQVRDQGLNPDWFYPRTVVQDGDSIRIHWSLRPEVQQALELMKTGVTPDEAARLASLAAGKSLEDLITNDTVWSGVDAPLERTR